MEIYKTTNKITGEYYIGLNSTSNPNYLGSGVDLKTQINEYGKENFIKEILCIITSNSTDENILKKIENLYIDNHIQDKNCLNKSHGYTNSKKNINKKIHKTEKKGKILIINPKSMYSIKDINKITGINCRKLSRVALKNKVYKQDNRYLFTGEFIINYFNLKNTKNNLLSYFKKCIYNY